jgi:hypothetical protein
MASKDGRLPEKRGINWGASVRGEFDFKSNKCYEEAVKVLGWSKERLASAIEVTPDSSDSDDYTPEGKLKDIFNDEKRDLSAEIKLFLTDEEMLTRLFTRKKSDIIDNPKKPSKSVRLMMKAECLTSRAMLMLVKAPRDIVDLVWEQLPPALAYTYRDVSSFSPNNFFLLY